MNKIVTLGTPHKGIAFRRMKSLKWFPLLEAGSEIERFNPDARRTGRTRGRLQNFAKALPLDRILRRRDVLPGLQRGAGDD